jgi:DnaJ-class molecular chaperone
VLKYHPDHNQKGEWDTAALGERTRLIIEAHKTLRNAAKRAEYDRGRFF